MHAIVLGSGKVSDCEDVLCANCPSAEDHGHGATAELFMEHLALWQVTAPTSQRLARAGHRRSVQRRTDERANWWGESGVVVTSKSQGQRANAKSACELDI
jgi:hypothetical protein